MRHSPATLPILPIFTPCTHKNSDINKNTLKVNYNKFLILTLYYVITEILQIVNGFSFLITCWIGAFASAAVRKILELPEGIEPVAMTPLGYPGDSPAPKKRKSLPEILHLDKFGNR
jgi:nitroreductase